jgi:hypothetical protein
MFSSETTYLFKQYLIQNNEENWMTRLAFLSSPHTMQQTNI